MRTTKRTPVDRIEITYQPGTSTVTVTRRSPAGEELSGGAIFCARRAPAWARGSAVRYAMTLHREHGGTIAVEHAVRLSAKHQQLLARHDWRMFSR